MTAKEDQPLPAAESDKDRLLGAEADSNLVTIVAKPGPIDRFRRVVTVEPVVFLATFVFMIVYASVRVEFLLQAVGKSLNYSSHSQDGNQSSDCSVNRSDPNYILGERVQAIASYWSLGFSVTSSLLTLFSALFIGSYSERGGGRKVPLLIPLIGLLLYTINLLIVIQFDLPLPYIFIGEVVCGCTGGFFVAFAIGAAYIADISKKEQLTVRLIMIDTAAFAGASVSQVGVGHWIKRQGFIPPLWMSLGVTVFNIFYVVFWIKETKTRQKVDVSFRDQFKDVFRLFLIKPTRNSYQLAIVTLVFFLGALQYTSSGITFMYVMAPPYCFDAVYLSYYQTLAFLTTGFGLLAGGKLLSCFLGDLGMAQVSFLSGLCLYLFLAYPQNSIMLLCAPVPGLLAGVSTPVLRSRASKLVHSTQQGVLFTFLGCIQGMAQTVSPLAFNTLYSSTVDFMPNLIYLVFASVSVLMIIIVGAIQVWECVSKKRLSEYPADVTDCPSVNRNPESSPTKNYPTVSSS